MWICFRQKYISLGLIFAYLGIVWQMQKFCINFLYKKITSRNFSLEGILFGVRKFTSRIFSFIKKFNHYWNNDLYNSVLVDLKHFIDINSVFEPIISVFHIRFKEIFAAHKNKVWGIYEILPSGYMNLWESH